MPASRSRRATSRQRAQRNAPTGLVDWQRVEDLAAARLAAAPGALSPAELHAADADYARAMAAAIPLLEQHLGRPLPGVVERHEVVDRAAWARANIVTFESLVERHGAARSRGDRRSGSGRRSRPRCQPLHHHAAARASCSATWARACSGQYDIALLSAETSPGKLLFVEENIRQTAAMLGVPPSDFRTWIVLHEATHAFEFEANDWVRPYMRDRLEQQLAGVLDQARDLQSGGLGALIERLREARDNPIAAFLTPEQRRLFDETQRVMSLLEGFSDWVMDEVGAQVLPDVGMIRDRFEARRSQRRGSVRPDRCARDRPRSEARAIPPRRAVRLRRGRGRRHAGDRRAVERPVGTAERRRDGRSRRRGCDASSDCARRMQPAQCLTDGISASHN